MSGMRVNGIIGTVLSIALTLGSTNAAAAAVPGAAVPQQISPWAALTALSAGAPAATLCGAAATAVAMQGPATGCVLPAIDAPPPVAVAEPAPVSATPVVPVAPHYIVSPLFLALAALTTGALIYFLVRNNHHTISPA
ncbi:hypothetical protein [Sphingomonas sp.]|uniref:hypothetical protein n=1 Tax=Sphingomonas sp. TaxID=28214 RepID=UPI0025FEB41A|nr:hypothetical protein [Sphingomonas sp.]MBV9527421.1 hypothetical protein [Sphingomonas sp.]